MLHSSDESVFICGVRGRWGHEFHFVFGDGKDTLRGIEEDGVEGEGLGVFEDVLDEAWGRDDVESGGEDPESEDWPWSAGAR